LNQTSAVKVLPDQGVFMGAKSNYNVAITPTVYADRLQDRPPARSIKWICRAQL